eukprot:NODE_12585_length_276_cov_17.537445_g11672_i0.p2 GENE.NODE_12585_length_276_cov_17.537445_g11672_i0~~NODE_12585_length_276_cov_17.537445_g11672_i0.p2  ORF type:complete len:59 (-),score=5.68 NODE_12585_length_276_cov_17.537445_g11672_i0:3-179(-)
MPMLPKLPGLVRAKLPGLAWPSLLFARAEVERVDLSVVDCAEDDDKDGGGEGGWSSVC